MKTQNRKGKKVFSKNTSKKRTSNKKSSKKVSLLTRFQGLSRRSQVLVFGLAFAVIGGGYYLYQSLASDGLPTGSNDLVISYEIGMAHRYYDDNFMDGMGPSLLLYGNGLMLCNNDATMSHDSSSMPDMPAWNSRQLSREEMHVLVDKLKAGGFDKAISNERVDTLVDPVSLGRYIRINTSEGAEQASLFPNNPSSDFVNAENILKAECAKTTLAYEPADTYAETILLSSDSPEAKQATVALPANVDVDTNPNGKKSKELKGKEAKALKSQLSRTPKVYKKGNQAVRARYVDRIPDWDELKAKPQNNKGKVSAAADYKTRWIIFVPSGDTVPSWATTSMLADEATAIRNWYKNQVGKTFEIGEYKVIRGNKTTSEYQVCPASSDYDKVCRNNDGWDGFNAAWYNIQNELSTTLGLTGWSTNTISTMDFGLGCAGLGGPASLKIDDNWVGKYNYGFALSVTYGSNGCSKDSSRRFVAAHELGHTLGLSHTCNRTLMSASGGSCPQAVAWPDVNLGSTQRSLLAKYSPYFISVANKTTTTTTTTTSISLTDSVSSIKGDFNGDGKTDIAALYDYGSSTSGLWVFTSTGSAFSPVKVWSSPTGGFNATKGRLFAGDFNGDGKSDVAVVYDYGGSTTGIWQWNGNGAGSFAAPVRTWYGTSWAASNSKYAVGDFNGDGKSDFASIYDYGSSTSGIWMFTSTGNGFSAAKVWSSASGGWNTSKARLLAGDFSGDGKSDVAAVYDYGGTTTGIWQWNGSGTGTLGAPAHVWNSASWTTSKSRYSLGDFNGDGKTDVASMYDYGSSTTGIWVFTSTGNGFSTAKVWSSASGGWNANSSRLLTGDFNGDGKDDFGAVYDYGGSTTGIWKWNGNGTGTFVAPARAWYGTSWSTSKAKYASID